MPSTLAKQCHVCHADMMNASSKPLSFYRFPSLSFKTWRKIWLAALGLPSDFSPKSMEHEQIICSRHFTSDCFLHNGKLVVDSVPTLLLSESGKEKQDAAMVPDEGVEKSAAECVSIEAGRGVSILDNLQTNNQGEFKLLPPPTIVYGLQHFLASRKKSAGVDHIVPEEDAHSQGKIMRRDSHDDMDLAPLNSLNGHHLNEKEDKSNMGIIAAEPMQSQNANKEEELGMKILEIQRIIEDDYKMLAEMQKRQLREIEELRSQVNISKKNVSTGKIRLAQLLAQSDEILNKFSEAQKLELEAEIAVNNFQRTFLLQKRKILESPGDQVGKKDLSEAEEQLKQSQLELERRVKDVDSIRLQKNTLLEQLGEAKETVESHFLQLEEFQEKLKIILVSSRDRITESKSRLRENMETLGALQIRELHLSLCRKYGTLYL